MVSVCPSPQRRKKRAISLDESVPFSEGDRRTIDLVLSLNDKSINCEVPSIPSIAIEDEERSCEVDNEGVKGEEEEEEDEAGKTNEEVRGEMGDELSGILCLSELIGRAKKVASPFPAKKSSSA